MVGPLLCIVVPLLAAVIGCVFHKKPAERMAGWVRSYSPARALITLALLLIAGVTAAATDILDLSDLLTEDTTQQRDHLIRFEKDLRDIFHLSGADLESVKAQFREILNGPKAPSSRLKVYGLSLMVGFGSAVYLLLNVWNTATEGVLTHQIRKLESQLSTQHTLCLDEERKGRSALTLLKRVEVLVVSRLKRLKRVSTSFSTPAITSEEKLARIREALSSDAQIQALVGCFHAFLLRPEIPLARVCVALYLPQDQYLRVIASTDGEEPNVITSPNDLYEDHFRHDTMVPMSLAVRVFQEQTACALPNCDDPRFIKFKDQNSEIRSVAACPLIYSPGPIIGVLFAESNVVNYFQNDKDFLFLLQQYGNQIGLRVNLDFALRKILD